MSYTKLSSRLTRSSVWSEPDAVRIVWVTMLSLADQDGNVYGSIVGIAHEARESLEDTQKAITRLSAPDQFSGRKELDGRRIIEIEGGWHLVTHGYYREEGMSESTRAYWRERKRESRSSETVRDNVGQSEKVGLVHGNGAVEGKKVQEEGESFDAFWTAYPNKQGKMKARSAWCRIRKSDIPAIMTSLGLWRESEEWTKENGRFIPHPSTFLNQHRWEDRPRVSGNDEQFDRDQREWEEKKKRGEIKYAPRPRSSDG